MKYNIENVELVQCSRKSIKTDIECIDIMREIEILKQIALKEREILMQKYGNTFGKCIEATDNIVEYLLKVEPKLKPEAKQVWVLYENFEGCTDICYEEHWLAKVLVKGYPYLLM